MRIIETPRFRLAQAPPPPPPGGDPMGGGAPPGAAPAMAPPPPPSPYLFNQVAKDESGNWGAYFTVAADGRRIFVDEKKIRNVAEKKKKTMKPDVEINKAIARLDAEKAQNLHDSAQVSPMQF